MSSASRLESWPATGRATARGNRRAAPTRGSAGLAASQIMTIAMSNDAEYTSVSVALSHTLDIPPNASPAATAATVSRVHRATRLAAMPAATAVQTAASRLVASAVGRN